MAKKEPDREVGLFFCFKKCADTSTRVKLSDLFCLAELVLAYCAKRTFKIVGQVLEASAGCYTELGITKLLIIFPAAYITYILFHN